MANVRLLSRLQRCRQLMISVSDTRVGTKIRICKDNVPRHLAHEPENEEWSPCDEIIFNPSDRVQPLHDALRNFGLVTHCTENLSSTEMILDRGIAYTILQLFDDEDVWHPCR